MLSFSQAPATFKRIDVLLDIELFVRETLSGKNRRVSFLRLVQNTYIPW